MTKIQKAIIDEVESSGYIALDTRGHTNARRTGLALIRHGYFFYWTGQYMGIAKTAIGAKAACLFANNRHQIQRLLGAIEGSWFYNYLVGNIGQSTAQHFAHRQQADTIDATSTREPICICGHEVTCHAENSSAPMLGKCSINGCPCWSYQSNTHLDRLQS